MSIPHNSTYFYLFNHLPPKLLHYSYSFFTIYYTIVNSTYIPIAISKPNSTQLPRYFTIPITSFPTFQQLQTFILNNNPLK